MITTVILLCLMAAGALLMGAKYGLGAAPAGYHVQIVESDGSLSGGTRQVIHALYRVMGGAMASSGLGMAALALGPVRSGSVAAALVAIVMGALVVVPSAVLPYRVEKTFGIETPWRIAAIFGVVLAAALISLLF